MTVEVHHKAKLTWAEVREIRRLYERHSQRHGEGALALKFGVSQRAVSDIVTGHTWKDTNKK